MAFRHPCIVHKRIDAKCLSCLNLSRHFWYHFPVSFSLHCFPLNFTYYLILTHYTTKYKSDSKALWCQSNNAHTSFRYWSLLSLYSSYNHESGTWISSFQLTILSLNWSERIPKRTFFFCLTRTYILVICIAHKFAIFK